MKYIIINRLGIPSAILLADHVNHSDAVNLAAVKPVSSGFCSLRNGCVYVERGSNSLNLHSRPEDADIIRLTLHLTGLMPITSAADLARATSVYLSTTPTNVSTASLP